MTTTADWQVELRGLILGAGTDYEVSGPWDGLGLPGLRTSDAERPLDDGDDLGADWHEGRLLKFAWHLLADDEADALDLAQALTVAWGRSQTDIEMGLQLGGRQRIVRGRPRSCEIDLDRLPQATPRAVCTFKAGDPRIYDVTEQSGQCGLQIVEGGLTFGTISPTAGGVTFGTITAGGGWITAENEGTADTPCVLTIEGPVTDPRVVLIAEDGTQKTVDLTLTVPGGSRVVIDSHDGTVTQDGSTSQFAALTAESTPVRQFRLPPGTNSLRFLAASPDADARLTAQWRSAWFAL